MYPLMKFGLDEHIMKNMLFPKEINLNDKLIDLMSKEQANILKNDESCKEFRCESEFISRDFSNNNNAPMDTVKINNNIEEMAENLEKSEKKEEIVENNEINAKEQEIIETHQNEINFNTVSNFIPIDNKTVKTDIYASNLQEVDQILQTIDELQMKDKYI